MKKKFITILIISGLFLQLTAPAISLAQATNRAEKVKRVSTNKTTPAMSHSKANKTSLIGNPHFSMSPLPSGNSQVLSYVESWQLERGNSGGVGALYDRVYSGPTTFYPYVLVMGKKAVEKGANASLVQRIQNVKAGEVINFEFATIKPYGEATPATFDVLVNNQRIISASPALSDWGTAESHPVKYDYTVPNGVTTLTVKLMTSGSTANSGSAVPVVLNAFRTNQAPVINGVKNQTITQGATFDPMNGVTATDSEDGDLTSQVKVTGSVNTNVPGSYTLKYNVTDSQGEAAAEKQATITVNPKPNNPPFIVAFDQTIIQGSTFDPLKDVWATDGEDGHLPLTLANVIVNNVNTQVPGTYNVTYSVTDSGGLTTTKGINVTVVENQSRIEFEKNPLTLYQGTPFPNTPKEAGVTAYDVDGTDITDKVSIKESNVDTNLVGRYTVTYEVETKNGPIQKTLNVNVEKYTINLKNGSFEKPVMTIPNAGQQFADDTPELEWHTTAIDKKVELQNMTAYGPAPDGNQWAELNANTVGALYQDIQTVPGTIIHWSVWHRGRFGTDVAKVKFGVPNGEMEEQKTMQTSTRWTKYSGVYKIPEGQTVTRFQFEAVSTSSGDNSTGNLIDNVVFTDEQVGEKPVIQAEDKTIQQGTTFDPLEGVSATDKEDGRVEVRVHKNNVDTTTPGEYSVTYWATDKDMNTTEKDIKVTVVANELSMSVPDAMTFKETKLNGKLQKVQRLEPNWQIGVMNTAKANWQLKAQSADITDSSNHSYKDALVFVDSNGKEASLAETTLIAAGTSTESSSTIKWNDDRGILFAINPTVMKAGTYTGKINWTLENAPS